MMPSIAALRPPPRSRRGWATTFGIDGLKRGEAVHVTGVKPSAVRTYVSRLGRAYDPPKLFQTVLQPDGSTMVWRID